MADIQHLTSSKGNNLLSRCILLESQDPSSEFSSNHCNSRDRRLISSYCTPRVVREVTQYLYKLLLEIHSDHLDQWKTESLQVMQNRHHCLYMTRNINGLAVMRGGGVARVAIENVSVGIIEYGHHTRHSVS